MDTADRWRRIHPDRDGKVARNVLPTRAAVSVYGATGKPEGNRSQHPGAIKQQRAS